MALGVLVLCFNRKFYEMAGHKVWAEEGGNVEAKDEVESREEKGIREETSQASHKVGMDRQAPQGNLRP
jgi:hypothetical protein